MTLFGTDYNLRAGFGDLFGGLTAAVVVLPAALAFGIASGLGAEAGLYGAIAVGFFAAVFGGTPSQISGPTGPMAVAVAIIVTTHASSIVEALTVVSMAGVIQVLLGLTGIGRFVAYTPQSVISGFMSGIGLIIILIQGLAFIGAPSAGGPIESVTALIHSLGNVNFEALAIAVFSLLVAVFWPRKLANFVPGPVIALVAGTALGMYWLTGAPTLGAISMGMPSFALEIPSVDFLLSSIGPALILALLGSIDSLLTSLIADSLTGSHHKPNQELVGQGFGNIFAGMFGGLACAGNTLGTVTNVRAGGSTPISGVFYAVLLLCIVLGLGQFLGPVPIAVLSGILVKIGIDIIDWRAFRYILKMPRGYVVVMVATMAITVFIDLVTAVTVGLIAAGMTHARQLENLELDHIISVPVLDRTFFHEEMDSDDPFVARVGLVSLNGTFTVASSHRLMSAYGTDLKEHEIVIFDLSETIHMDESSALVIQRLIGLARSENTEVIIVGMSDVVRELWTAFNVLENIPKEHTVGKMEEARTLAMSLLNRVDSQDTQEQLT